MPKSVKAYTQKQKAANLNLVKTISKSIEDKVDKYFFIYLFSLIAKLQEPKKVGHLLDQAL